MSADKPITFRGSLSPIMSAIKIGSDLMRISIDVPRSDLQKAIGLTALEGVALKFVISVDDSPYATPEKLAPIEKPKREKKPAKERGEHGMYWNSLCKLGLFSNRDFHTALENELEMEITDYEQATRAFFGVTSRTFISPEQFEAWLSTHHLDNLVLMSGQAVRQSFAKCE